MNSRRNFFKQIALGSAAFSILPAAETYSRIWRPKRIVYEINPDWITAEYEAQWIVNSGKVDGALVVERIKKLYEPPFDCEPYPVRFKMRGGILVHVPSWIEV